MVNLRNEINEMNSKKEKIEELFQDIVYDTLGTDNFSLEIRANSNMLFVELCTLNRTDEYIYLNSFFFEKMNEIGYYQMHIKENSTYSNKYTFCFDINNLN